MSRDLRSDRLQLAIFLAKDIDSRQESLRHLEIAEFESQKDVPANLLRLKYILLYPSDSETSLQYNIRSRDPIEISLTFRRYEKEMESHLDEKSDDVDDVWMLRYRPILDRRQEYHYRRAVILHEISVSSMIRGDHRRGEHRCHDVMDVS